MASIDSPQTVSRKKRVFLKALAKSGVIRDSARVARLSLNRVKRFRRKNPKFEARVQQALEGYVTVLEKEADRRGIKGVKEPVFYEGDICGYKKKYSEGLLQFRLKALAPEKYRERTDVKVEGDGDTHITVYLPENGRPDKPAAKS